LQRIENVVKFLNFIKTHLNFAIQTFSIKMNYKLIIWCITFVACTFKVFTYKNKAVLSDDVIFTPITKKEAKTLLNNLAAKDFIEFRYANNHCEDRAHAMAKLISDEGIGVGKAWIFVNGIFNNKYPKVLKIYDKNKLDDTKDILTWKYHVAPVIKTINGDTLVIDPSLCQTPVSLKEWFDKMNVTNELKIKDVFFLIKDWKYQTYSSKDNQSRLMEAWRLDPDFKMTRQGLCEGKICYQFYLDNIDDATLRKKAKKFNALPEAYRSQREDCMKALKRVLVE
jgi:hypothetical protein